MPGTSGSATGLLGGYERRHSDKSGKDFAVFFIDGQEYSAWDDAAITQAELAQGFTSQVHFTQKENSKFRVAKSVSVVGEGGASTHVGHRPVASATPVPTSSLDQDVQIRIAAATVAARALAGGVGFKAAPELIAFAQEVEAYLHGLDLGPKPTS